MRTLTSVSVLVVGFTSFHPTAFGQITGPTINFGSVTVGATSTPIQVPGCCSNYDYLAHVWSFRVTGSFGIYPPGTTCGPGFIQSGEVCKVTLTFAPTSSGLASGSLSLFDLTSMFPNVATNIWPLTGSGVPPNNKPPPPLSPCDINGDGVTNVVDVQAEVNLVLGTSDLYRSRGDIDGDGVITVADVQRVVNAGIGLGCNTAH